MQRRWLAAANRLIPPNVFYFEHAGLASKYAVLSEADFAHECSPEAWTVSTAARFSQPSRLVWSADENAAERIIETVSNAAPTLLGWVPPMPTERLDHRPLEARVPADVRCRIARRARGSVSSDRRCRPCAVRAFRRQRDHPERPRLGSLVARASSGTGRFIRSPGSPKRASPSPAAPITSRGRSTATPARTSS